MIRAAIEISPSAIRTRVSEIGAEGVDGLVDRFVPVRVRQANLDRIEAIVADGAGAARKAGAGAVDLIFTPDLKGSRIARLIERKVAPVVSAVRSPETGARIASRFIVATTGDSVVNDGTPVGVVGLGHVSLGLAVGGPGRPPAWIASRPLGLDRVASRVRFQDPPTPVQLEVARVSCARSLGTLQPPAFDAMLVVSDFAPTMIELCGSEATGGMLDSALDWTLGRTSEELSAITGFDPHLARLLPVALAIQQALVDSFGLPLIPVGPDPAAEVALSDLAPVGRER